jgi:spectrin beta
VYQFARDAAVAEAWIDAQEPYLKSRNFGRNLEEVIALIKKHEAFEKSALAQEDRFLALEKLTNFELKEMQRRDHAAEEERRRRGLGGKRGSRTGETTFPATEESSRSHEGMRFGSNWSFDIVVILIFFFVT